MALNKIHHNNSTTISLNDRFTIMQTYAPPSAPAGGSTRNRTTPTKGSRRNRQLLNQFETQHKILDSQILKRRSMRQKRGTFLKNAVKNLNISPQGTRLRRRANSLTNLAT